MYYSPKCGHCKRFMPHWVEFHDKHKDEINVGRVDCIDKNGKPLCNKYDVQAFPTLKYFPNDNSKKVYLFSDSRNLEMAEKFALEDGYLKANYMNIPEEKGLMERLSKLELFSSTPASKSSLLDLSNNKAENDKFTDKKTWDEIVPHWH